MSRIILVPYDGSEESKAALGYARGLADDERVVALVVVEPIPTRPDRENPSAPYERAFEDARDRLAEARELAEDAASVDAEFCYGHPLHEILGYVDRYVVEEVVMGRYGRDEAGELLLGNVAESVVRRSPVPVTVVGPEGSAGRPDPLETVLVPFDGSAPAREALEYALGRFPGAAVTALYADYPATGDGEVGPCGDGSTGFDDWYERVAAWHARADRDAGSVLGLAEDVADGHGLEVETATEPGDPTRVVVDHAERTGVDHVVVGSHSREGVTRRLLGSVAAFVVRRSPASVTVVR
ncbi:MAG: universal stress protein [Haloarculaceae archaeon]